MVDNHAEGQVGRQPGFMIHTDGQIGKFPVTGNYISFTDVMLLKN